ncbi:MAG TPA: response regulator [Myxococcota bacterium]|nr:response regulator [Myxococcota bacterium]
MRHDSGSLSRWLARAEAAFVSPHLRGDPVALRTAFVVAGFSLAPALFVPFLAWMGWESFPREVAVRILPLVLLAAPVCVLVSVTQRFAGPTALAGNFMLAYAFALFGIVTYYAGGAVSPPSFWNVLIPMTAIALVGRRWAAFWAVMVLAEAVATVWLDRHGLHFENRILPQWRPLYWFASIGSLTTLIMLAGLVYERTKDAALHTLEAANAELERARDDADRASAAKSDFLAILTHEIRTPMTAILGFADVLRDEWAERGFPARQIDALATIQRSGRELLETINDLLDLSKIEAGKLELEQIAFSPGELISSVLEPLRPRALELGLELSFELEAAVPGVVQSDPARLRQIAVHLLENALAFTAQGGVQVSLGVSDEGQGPQLDLRVRDTGFGIPPEKLASLFQPGLRRAACADASERIGLGLAMCKRLTELLGGRIEVESELGHGSLFRVLVPIRPASAPAWSPARFETPAHSRPTLRAHVLVVDDGPDNLRLISHVLGRAGADVVTASDGRRALACVREAERAGRPFDVVLMDMQMPEMDGYAATAELRRSGFTRPILALTAHAVPGTRESCLAAGCDDFATKPVDRHELIERINRLCPDILPSGSDS